MYVSSPLKESSRKGDSPHQYPLLRNGSAKANAERATARDTQERIITVCAVCVKLIKELRAAREIKHVGRATVGAHFIRRRI